MKTDAEGSAVNFLKTSIGDLQVVQVMSIWREASAHMLTTLVLVVVGYLLHLMVTEASGAQRRVLECCSFVAR